MAMVAKYESDILDAYSELKSKMGSNRKELLSETYHYVSKYNRITVEKDKFKKHQDFIRKCINKYSEDLNESINHYIDEIIKKQKSQVESVMNDILENVSNLSIDDIQTKIYNAKHGISEITRQKLDHLDVYIEDNINDSLREYSESVDEKLTDSEINEISKEYCKGIGENITSVKNKFADTTRSEIEFYYDKSLEILKNYKNGKELEDINTNTNKVENITSPELQANLENKVDTPENRIKAEDLNLGSISLTMLETIIGSMGVVKLTIENGYVIAKDENNIEYNIRMKVEESKVMLKLQDLHDNTKEPIGVEINTNTNSVCVKRSNIDVGVVYDIPNNQLQVKKSNIKYLFKFENGVVKGFIINENGEQVEISAEEIEKNITNINSQGININELIALGIDNSRGTEGRSTERN